MIGATVTLIELQRNEKIQMGDLHSLGDNRGLQTIKDPSTIGQTPSDFSPERRFWRIYTGFLPERDNFSIG